MEVLITEFIDESALSLFDEAGVTYAYKPEAWQGFSFDEKALASLKAIIVRNKMRVGADLLDQCPQLQVIGRLGVGLDNIDVTAAKKRGVSVVSARNANAISVAEYVIAAMLAVVRRLREADEHVTEGGWDRHTFTGLELYGKTLGLIGCGEIAQRLALRAKSLGMNVIGHDPYVAPYDFAPSELKMQLRSLDEVLERADFVSLHVPLTEGTRHLIDYKRLKQMKSSAYLINTSRGGVIQEEHLRQALQEGRLAGAVLDVLEEEPPHRDHPLLGLKGVLVTPHIAGLTVESQARVARLVIGEVLHELQGDPSICRV